MEIAPILPPRYPNVENDCLTSVTTLPRVLVSGIVGSIPSIVDSIKYTSGPLCGSALCTRGAKSCNSNSLLYGFSCTAARVTDACVFSSISSCALDTWKSTLMSPFCVWLLLATSSAQPTIPQTAVQANAHTNNFLNLFIS